jgi:hypothetical protein
MCRVEGWARRPASAGKRAAHARTDHGLETQHHHRDGAPNGHPNNLPQVAACHGEVVAMPASHCHAEMPLPERCLQAGRGRARAADLNTNTSPTTNAPSSAVPSAVSTTRCTGCECSLHAMPTHRERHVVDHRVRTAVTAVTLQARASSLLSSKRIVVH